MHLVNEFSVGAPLDDVWSVLTDIPTVVECIPGAVLDRRDGTDFHAHVGVKIGPVGMTLVGVATVVDQDDSAHRMVVHGTARDRSGNGSTEATVHMTAREQAGRSMVTVTTDLELSGRMAQFGTGVVTQVGNRIIGQFVKRLDAVISGGDLSAAVRTPGAAAAGSHRTDLRAVAVVGLAGVAFGLALGRWADRLSRAPGRLR